MLNTGDKVSFLAYEINVQDGIVCTLGVRKRFTGTVVSINDEFVKVRPSQDQTFDGTRSGVRVDGYGLRKIHLTDTVSDIKLISE